MKLQTKHLLPVILGTVLLTLAATSVYADPLVAGGNVMAGNQYTVTTIRDQASAWVNGQWLTGPADLELQVQVTFVSPHNLVFKVISGSVQVGNMHYMINAATGRVTTTATPQPQYTKAQPQHPTGETDTSYSSAKTLSRSNREPT